MALQAEEDATCAGCGQPMDESMHPAHDGDYQAAYLTCFGCRALERAKQDLTEGAEPEPGLRLSVTKTT